LLNVNYEYYGQNDAGTFLVKIHWYVVIYNVHKNIYLRRSSRISKKERIRNVTIR